MKQLIATDLDGTISFVMEDQNGVVTPYTKKEDMEQLDALQDAGHLTAISTGRDITGIQSFLNLSHKTFDYYIGGNGSIITDKDFNIISKDIFPHELSIEIVTYMNKHYPDLLITGFDGFNTYYIEHSDQTNMFELDQNTLFEKSIAELSNEGTSYIAIDFSPKSGTYDEKVDYMNSIYEEVSEKFADKVGIFQNQYFIDLTPKGISKGSAVTFLSEHTNTPLENVHTIGDSWNDLSMFEVTKNSNTFPRADEKLQQLATNVVESYAQMAKAILGK